MANDEVQPNEAAEVTEVSDEELDAVAGGINKNDPRLGKKKKK